MNEEWLEEAFRGELEVTHTDHPSDAVLLGYVLEVLEPTEEEEVSLHVATCSRCSARVSELRSEAPVWETRPDFLPDPLRVTPPIVQGQGLAGRLQHVWRAVTEGIVPEGRAAWRPILVRAGAYVTAALLILATNLVLDRLLVPKPSPLGSPVKVNRWWVHLYWLLVPWGFLLGWRVVRLRRRRRKNGHHEEERP